MRNARDNREELKLLEKRACLFRGFTQRKKKQRACFSSENRGLKKFSFDLELSKTERDWKGREKWGENSRFLSTYRRFRNPQGGMEFPFEKEIRLYIFNILQHCINSFSSASKITIYY